MFDFNERPARMYSLWPSSQMPVEVSIYGLCQCACFYCFSNLNRKAANREPHMKNPTEKLIDDLDRWLEAEQHPIGWFMRNGFPVCFSNNTDPFQRAEREHRSSEAFLSWTASHGVPVFLQTRGEVLAEDWGRYKDHLSPSRDGAYVSLETLDAQIARRIAPGAPPPGERLDMVATLAKHGLPVTLACNPYVSDWCADKMAFCREAKSAGAASVFVDPLHLKGKQLAQIPNFYRDETRKANLSAKMLMRALCEWREAGDAVGIPVNFRPDYHARLDTASDVRRGESIPGGWRYFDDLIHDISVESLSSQRPALVTWEAVSDYLRAATRGCNPVLDVELFWVVFNSQITADHREWKATFGKSAPLFEILRYFWNHPWNKASSLWTHPRMKLVGTIDSGELEYLAEEGDLIYCFDPTRIDDKQRVITDDESFENAYRWSHDHA